MKKGIHPEYHDAKVKCACGEEYVVGSTVKEIRLEVCSNCHPFFTGKHKFVDTAGRVDKFFRKYGDNVEPRKKQKKKKRVKVLEAEQGETQEAPEEVLDSAEVTEQQEAVEQPEMASAPEAPEPEAAAEEPAASEDSAGEPPAEQSDDAEAKDS